MSVTSEESVFSYHQKVTDQANKVSKLVVFVFLFIALLLSPFHATWTASLTGGLVLVGLFFIPSALGAYNRYLNSFVLAGFTVLFHLQLHGLPASHFFYFVVLTVLLFYEDWKVLMPAFIVHLVFVCVLFFKSDHEYARLFLEAGGPLSLVDFLLHVLIVAAYTTLCAMWSMLQRKQTAEAALQADEMKRQLSMIETNQKFAESISQGNLEAEYSAAKADTLGESLMTMRKSLIDASEREEKERFRTTGLATIGEILRTHVNDLQGLCDAVLKEVLRYMNANQGSIFTVENTDSDQAHLKLMSTRAWDRKKFLEKRIEIGQGLVGQVVLEKTSIYMTDLPNEYVSITSGLGQANPRSILIVPLTNEERVVGVLELASFKKFESFQIEFLEKVGESIASTILNSRNNERTKVLLEQSHSMTEQMKAQEEEMRQNMEEMQATQEEMERTQRMLSQQTEEVHEQQTNLNALINATSDSIIAMDKAYKIIVMNDTLRLRYKGTQYEALRVGSDALQTLGAVRDEWKKYYDRALSGEHLQFVLKSTVNGEDAFREYFINPMLDERGDVFGLSVVSRDVSKRQKVEIETSQRGFIINALINFTSDTYFAINRDFKILIANTTLKDRFKASGVELNEGKLIMDVLSEEAQKIWRPRYEAAFKGERLHFNEERKVGDSTLYLEVFIEPIFDNDNSVLGCAVVSRDITEQKQVQENLAKLQATLAVNKGA